jgi:hypothetical protein
MLSCVAASLKKMNYTMLRACGLPWFFLSAGKKLSYFVLSLFIFFPAFLLSETSFANPELCKEVNPSLMTKEQQIALCETKMAVECGELIKNFDYDERSRKLRKCGEEWSVTKAVVGLPLLATGECVVGGVEGVWDTVTFIPKGLWSAWKLAKQSSEEQFKFTKFCDNDPTSGCKRDLMKGVPSLEGLDPSKIGTNDIIQKRNYWLRTIKNEPKPWKSLFERAEEGEAYARKREAQGDTPESRQDFQELMARAKMTLAEAGIKFECYNFTYQTSLICYGASSLLVGTKGIDKILKAKKLAGATHADLPKIARQALKTEELVAGKKYAFQFRGETDIYQLEFLRREGDELVFKVGSKEYRRSAGDIHEVRASSVESKEMQLEDVAKSNAAVEKSESEVLKKAKAIFRSARNIHATAWEGAFTAGLLNGPTKKIAEQGSVQVLGKLTASKQVGLELANEVTVYDTQLKGLGFRLPDKTNIVLNDRPLLPNTNGPFSVSWPLTILGRGSAENTIAMNPFLYRSTAARDLSVLRHERTHSILHASYADDAYVNSSSMTQEAFADFFSAHAENNPVIGKAAISRNTAIRNIETREAGGDLRGPGVKGSTQRVSLMDVTGSGYHNNSLIISNALWRVRQAIGPETMNAVIKPIVDDLNLHRGSANINGTIKTAERARSEIQYNLASMRRTLSDRGLTDGVRQIDRLADELGITAPRLTEESNRLIREGDFTYRGRDVSNVQVIVFHAGGAAATGAVTGYGINQLIPETNFFVREPIKKESDSKK